MAAIVGVSTNQLEVEANKAARVSVVPRTPTQEYVVSDITGTIAAALAANSAIFAMRLDPGAGRLAFIKRIILDYTTIVAYTTPVTAGRRLAVFRGSGASASGGTSIPTVGQKDSTGGFSECNLAQGGDLRISTTGALTVTGITWETVPLAVFSLVHLGAAGAYQRFVAEWDNALSGPLVLQPGQLLGIRNPAAMDAAGTWQAAVTAEWYEGAAL